MLLDRENRVVYACWSARTYVSLLSSPIDTIEDLSGGGVRCMLAAVHLPAAEDERS